MHADKIIEATMLIAGGHEIKAALLLRDVIRAMEDFGADRMELASVVQLSADAWRRAAMRIAKPDGTSLPGVQQRMRVEFLAEAQSAYEELRDIPNMVRMTRAMGDAYMAQGKSLAAMQQLEDASHLATRYNTLDILETVPFLRQLAEACKAAFEQYATQHMPAHLDAGPKAAGYLSLVGDNVQAATYLSEVADQYHQAAVAYHQNGRHTNALNALMQAILMEVVTGREGALEHRADQLVQYSILNGDRKSLDVYDRAMRLTRNGSIAVANAIILERAKAVFFNSNSFSALRQYHDVMNEGLSYFVTLLKDLFTSEGVDETRLLRGVWIHLEVAFRYSMSWIQTLELLEPLRKLSSVRQMRSDGMELLRYGMKMYLSGLTMGSNYYSQSGYYVPSDPHLAQWLSGVSSDAPTNMHEVHLYLARQVGCTPAEIEAALTRYGDMRLVSRIKGVTGELAFAQLRYANLMNHYVSLKESRRRGSVRK